MVRSPSRCRSCGAPIYGSEYLRGNCLACLLGVALDPERAQAGGSGRFDHYEVVTNSDGTSVELGRGAMGITYRAIDTILGHPVALKVIDARLADHAEARDLFRREARAAAALRHPNVASVFYYGVRNDGECFYAMELVEGETLEMRLDRDRCLPVTVALEVVIQVARALAAAQNQQLVHRDLKPANLMLTEKPEFTVKVIDFGVARVPEHLDEARPSPKCFVGTPAFASPEQLAGAEVDTRSDLYSLGIILWQMLTGRLPFQGLRADPPQLRGSLPFHDLKMVPNPLVVLLQKLLASDPRSRFQNPAELLQALPAVINALHPRETGTSPSSEPERDWDAASRDTRSWSGPEKLSLARLPVTGRDVFGREEDLAFLDNAWANPQVNVVTIVAWAGVGKSSLVNAWLRRLAVENYGSAELVFGWSFYRQGNSGDSSSADAFINAALIWFGDPDPQIGTAWEKGERLAQLISGRRTLLILDGLEPLQNPPGPQEGRLRDSSLQAFLRELSAFNTGLCLITTRIAVADVADHERSSVLSRELEQLSSQAGAKLLRALGVKGNESELRRASDEFDGHCLALTLLGSYLADAYGGDIRCREDISTRLAHDPRQGAHARKVMESYRKWFGLGPELSVLRILGLFDRPAEKSAVEALQKPPVIKGLTESLAGLAPNEWRTIIASLRRARLVAPEDLEHRGCLDTHPLVREYFGEQLRTEQRAAWREGNRRLYNYYRTMGPRLPDSLQEMEPLFLSVICGCHAERYRDALHEVYVPRIQRGDACFAANVLGARSVLLLVLAHFFEPGRWGSLLESTIEGQSLTPEDRLFVLTQAALYLTATRGLGAPEARDCYQRAESLGLTLRRPLLTHVAMVGQWRYSLITDHLSTTLRLARKIYARAQEQTHTALRLGAYRALGATLFFLGRFAASRRYSTHGLRIWREANLSFPMEEPIAPAVSCLCYQALSNWYLGKAALCRKAMAEAGSLARELNDMHALSQALWFAGFLAQFENNPAEVLRLTSDLIEISTRQNFPYWLAVGTVFRGWAQSALGEKSEGIANIKTGLRAYRATGSVLDTPYLLALKAEAFHLAGRTSGALEAITEAEHLVEKHGQRFCFAELKRLRGVLLTASGAETSLIDESFNEAIRIAKQQKSVWLVERTEASRLRSR